MCFSSSNKWVLIKSAKQASGLFLLISSHRGTHKRISNPRPQSPLFDQDILQPSYWCYFVKHLSLPLYRKVRKFGPLLRRIRPSFRLSCLLPFLKAFLSFKKAEILPFLEAFDAFKKYERITLLISGPILPDRTVSEENSFLLFGDGF